MSEQPQPSQKESNSQTIIFMAALSFVCALILSLLASVLAHPQEVAKELDRNKQMLIAAKILDHEGHFLIQDKAGGYTFAKYEEGKLIPGTSQDVATNAQILEIFNKRIRPELVDKEGRISSFEEAHINEENYLLEYRKIGYYKQPQKLIYRILSNSDPSKTEGFVIPVNGFGLWDAIYGYLAISPDGNTVLGISWYDQKETPGLGAIIAESQWQNLFPGKRLFQESPSGTTDFNTAPLGIVVIKGKVVEVLGNQPKAKSAVDGMAGATLTGNGVTDAYRDVLNQYRPFLIKMHEKALQEKKTLGN